SRLGRPNAGRRPAQAGGRGGGGSQEAPVHAARLLEGAVSGRSEERIAVSTDARQSLSVNNVEVIYDHVILVLKGVSLAVPEGGIVALLGANGAGKSTTLKAISGLL